MQFLDMKIFEQAGRWLMAFLCQFIYPLITWIFDLFMNITKVNILSNKDIEPIYQRVTIILTIIMVFYVTFSFVKYVVQPDSMTDKEKGVGNIVYKIVAVILLIAFVPDVFGWAFTVQEKILDAGVIEKVILGNKPIDEKNSGANFSANIFSMFYEANTDTTFTKGDNIIYEGIVSENLRALREDRTLGNISTGLYDVGKVKTSYSGQYDEIEVPRINFQGVFAVLVGGFIAYILVLYCIDVGTRWAQMLFLQIMAPVAIIGYLAPKKDNMFEKWGKQCITTYLDLFIRLAIIYFILLVCEVLTTSYSNSELFKPLGNIGKTMEIFVYIVLVMGLLVFAKKAPKMLGELLPKGIGASGSFGLSAKDRFAPTKNALNIGKRVVGGAAGGLAGAVIGARTGRAISGMLKGAKTGGDKKGNMFGNIARSARAVSSDVQKDLDVKAKGGRIYGSRFFSGHYQNVSKRQDRELLNLEDMTKKKKAVASSIENLKFRKQMDSIGAALSSSGNVTASKAWDGIKKAAEKEARKYADGKITDQQLQRNMQALIDNFKNNTANNIDPNMDLNLDLELNASSKWGAVKTAIEDAKSTAKEISGTTYKDMNGNTQKITYNQDTFAEDIGDITDGAETAVQQKKASEEYKKPHTNAQGSNSDKK